MLISDRPGQVSVRFAQGPGEAIDYILGTRPMPWLRRSSYASIDGRDDVCGASWPQAMRLAREGWSEGAEKVSRGLNALITKSAPGIAHWSYDVAGAVPDVGRMLGGQPDCMMRRKVHKGAHPVVHIILNTALSGSVTGEQQINYGVAICGLVDLLERSGRRVELDRVGLVVGGDAGRRYLQGWKVKQASEALDLGVVAFALAHPAAHRRLVWAMRERTDCVGYGSPAKLRPADALAMDAEGAFLLDGVGLDRDRATTTEDALRLAVERLNTAAGEELVAL